jgi:uncharacterized protein (TIGR03083 family)
MRDSDYLAHLAVDFARLRAVAPIDLAAPVPTCPGWTVADLVDHVGKVYLHKTLAIRAGAEPDWPPAGIEDEEPLALLDRTYAELLREFSSHEPSAPGGSWYTPDQTVGFWFRRMAQETVIHRIDAELATGQPVAPVPADLAIDGIDELLKVFVAYGVSEWGSEFTEILGGSPGRTYAVRTDGAAWRARSGPGLFTVTDDTAGSKGTDGTADVTVSGPPEDVLRWLWNRQGTGATVEGAPEAVEELRRCLVTATQ